jgi:hypothetical protein
MKGSNKPITEECMRNYTDLLKSKQQFRVEEKDAQGKVVSKIVESPLQACDPKELNHLSFQDDWNEMIADLEKMHNVWCSGTEDFAALFCRECQIISERIYAMNKRAVGNGCADGATANAAPTDVKPETGDSKTER